MSPSPPSPPSSPTSATRLDPGRVQEALASERFYAAWHHHPTVGSTMDLARSLAQEGAPEGTIVSAEEQRSGRGRRGRGWHSPPGGAWFSFVLRPPIAPPEAGGISVLLGVSLARSLRDAYGVPVGVKWPNDLWLCGRKLGGILLETSARGERVEWIVAGVGINVNNPTPEGVPAISLREALGQRVPLEGFYENALRGIARDYRRFRREGFGFVRELWEGLSVPRSGEWIQVRRAGAEEPVPARAVGLSPRGRLVVEWEGSGRREELLAEDVSVDLSE